MNTATKFEFDYVAEHGMTRVTGDFRRAPRPNMAEVAAAYQRTARLNAAHAALMKAVW